MSKYVKLSSESSSMRYFLFIFNPPQPICTTNVLIVSICFILTVIWSKSFRVSFMIHLHTFSSFLGIFLMFKLPTTEWLYIFSVFHMNIGSLARMHWKTRKSGRRKSKPRLHLQPEVRDQRQLCWIGCLDMHKTKGPKVTGGFQGPSYVLEIFDLV